jgi:hypothetical protein
LFFRAVAEITLFFFELEEEDHFGIRVENYMLLMMMIMMEKTVTVLTRD